MKTVAVILNWNTLSVSKQSYLRLRREVPVIVVDNGSTDGSKEYYKNEPGAVLFDENKGSSVARNAGIAQAIASYDPEFIFFIDGDILYVPKTIAAYESIAKGNSDAAVVGHCNRTHIVNWKHNGTPYAVMADLVMPKVTNVSDTFPMAWTQYGLFRTSFLKDHPFVTVPPFDRAGHGYEDDWMYHEMVEAGMRSLAVPEPCYYHEAHAGLRNLAKTDTDTHEQTRRDVFTERWGKPVPWKDAIIEL